MVSVPDPRSVHHRTHPVQRSASHLVPVPNPDPQTLYGPQHVEISQLLAAVRRIDADSERAIERYWYDHRGAHRFAARGAASQVASEFGRLEAQIYARQQVWSASESLARDAAGDAAHAVAVRDLIGDVFTQSAYDDLVRAWARVMGPVHPDDRVPEQS